MFDNMPNIAGKMLVSRSEDGVVRAVMCGNCGCLNILAVEPKEESNMNLVRGLNDEDARIIEPSEIEPEGELDDDTEDEDDELDEDDDEDEDDDFFEDDDDESEDDDDEPVSSDYKPINE